MVAGMLLSSVSGLLLVSQFIRRLAERFTTRRIITIGLIMGGIAQIGLGILGEPVPRPTFSVHSPDSQALRPTVVAIASVPQA